MYYKADIGHMRSQKSRSRSNKSHRNRQSGGGGGAGGNVVNRVFDSSGPEGKVRGTPQQIIDKYNQLERDATLGNDRVAAENFQQHAEHYTRMLSEAQREQDAHRKEQEARREEQERQNRERQADRDRERAERQERDAAQRSEDPAVAPQPQSEHQSQPDVAALGAEQPDTNDSGLVETPESAPRKPARRPRTRRAAPKPDTDVAPTPTSTPDEPSEAAE